MRMRKSRSYMKHVKLRGPHTSVFWVHNAYLIVRTTINPFIQNDSRFFLNMSSQNANPIVSTSWLNTELNEKKNDLAVIDATWFPDKDASEDFAK